MAKINIKTDGVVIGSGSIAEHKMQVLNFMNMIYDIAFCGADRSNINSVFFNLKYEIAWLRWEKYYNTYGFHIEHFIDFLEGKIINHNVCEKDWFNILEALSYLFKVEYTLN